MSFARVTCRSRAIRVGGNISPSEFFERNSSHRSTGSNVGPVWQYTWRMTCSTPLICDDKSPLINSIGIYATYINCFTESMIQWAERLLGVLIGISHCLLNLEGAVIKIQIESDNCSSLWINYKIRHFPVSTSGQYVGLCNQLAKSWTA